MRPSPAELMRLWPISTRLNKPENDDALILESVELAVSDSWPLLRLGPRGPAYAFAATRLRDAIASMRSRTAMRCSRLNLPHAFATSTPMRS